MNLVFQVETTDKAPCARVLVEIIRPGDRPGLDSQKIVDWVSEQRTGHSKWAGLHAVTMRNKQIGRGGDWFITHYAVEMANLGTETIAEWRIDFDKGLGQGNVIKAQGSWIDQVAVPVPAGLRIWGIRAKHKFKTSAKLPVLHVTIYRFFYK